MNEFELLKQSAQDEADRRRRRRSRRQAARELAAALANDEGLRRLRMIPPERWKEAADGEAQA